MDPLKRDNPNVRATNHEDRIQALERRIIGEGGLPYATASYLDADTQTAGTTVNWGMTAARSMEPELFTHLPVVTAFNPGATTNIDGSLVVLQRGLYLVEGHVLMTPTLTQQLALNVVRCDINDPLGTPVAAAAYIVSQTTGSNASPVSWQVGSSIPGGSLYVRTLQRCGDGSTFKPVSFKLQTVLSSGSEVNFGMAMLIYQLYPWGCDGSPEELITSDGIPPDWEDAAAPC